MLNSIEILQGRVRAGLGLLFALMKLASRIISVKFLYFFPLSWCLLFYLLCRAFSYKSLSFLIYILIISSFLIVATVGLFGGGIFIALFVFFYYFILTAVL